MPIVAHSKLPTFKRMIAAGENVLTQERALQQDIRELHIGFLNLMPDTALEATERQFFRLIGACNRIAQFYVHPFTLPSIKRGAKAQDYIERYYESIEDIKAQGLDALIITGANIEHDDLTQEPFWADFQDILNWSYQHVTSTLCACLASHAALKHFHNLARTKLPKKKWGVYSHQLVNRTHPLVHNINTRFDLPHSRWNDISHRQFNIAGLHILVESKKGGVHLATSPDQFRFIYFQGHPEYDRNSLLKEYKREVLRFLNHELEAYPPLPHHYFGDDAKAQLKAFKEQALTQRAAELITCFPEMQILEDVDNTWGDTGKTVINNWLGLVYQITHHERLHPFMAGIDPNNPLKAYFTEDPYGSSNPHQ